MKFLRPLAPRPSSNAQVKPSTFGQARAVQLESRLKNAQQERKKLIRAEYAAEDPLDKVFKEKGLRADRAIERLKSEE